MGSDAAPAKFPPPWNQTITALRDLAGHSGVQIFKYRQSSLLFPPPCMQGAPKAVAPRTPAQVFTGMGSRQRSSPVGGCANGIPLNTAPRELARLPPIFPPLTETSGPELAAWVAVAAHIAHTVTSDRICVRMSLLVIHP